MLPKERLVILKIFNDLSLPIKIAGGNFGVKKGKVLIVDVKISVMMSITVKVRVYWISKERSLHIKK